MGRGGAVMVATRGYSELRQIMANRFEKWAAQMDPTERAIYDALVDHHGYNSLGYHEDLRVLAEVAAQAVRRT